MNFTGVLILKAATFFVIDIKTLKQSVSALPVSCLLKFSLSIVIAYWDFRRKFFQRFWIKSVGQIESADLLCSTAWFSQHTIWVFTNWYPSLDHSINFTLCISKGQKVVHKIKSPTRFYHLTNPTFISQFSGKLK